MLKNFHYGIDNEKLNINQHPWILSREDCIIKKLKYKHFNNFADIGVNDMYYTKILRTYTKETVYAVDIFFHDEETIIEDIICINNISKLPENKIDCILMMDVLEYIEDDINFLNIAFSKLRASGIIIITVPAWKFLFSSHDIRSKHLRRYDKKDFLHLISNTQFNNKIENFHYFYTILFLLRMIGSLKKEKYSGNEIEWKYPSGSFITILIKIILNVDFYINSFFSKINIMIPGLSILAICRKN